MALAFEMMRGGLSAGAAQAINGGGGVQSIVTAAGSSISDATALVSGFNVVTTVPAGSGVQLPNTQITDVVEIFNNQASENLTVYPPTGSTINQLSASTGVLLAPYTAIMLKKYTSTAWIGWMSA